MHSESAKRKGLEGGSRKSPWGTPAEASHTGN